MSANLYWAPELPERGTPLTVGAPSSFWRALSDAVDRGHDGLEIILTRADFDAIRGFRAGLNDKSEREAVSDLLGAIETHGAVRLWRVV